MSFNLFYLTLLDNVPTSSLELLELLDPAREEDQLIHQVVFPIDSWQAGIFADHEIQERSSFAMGRLPSIGESELDPYLFEDNFPHFP